MKIIPAGNGPMAAFDLDELMGLQGAALTLRTSVAEFGWPTETVAEGFFESMEFLQALENTLHSAVQQIAAPDQESHAATPERGEIMSQQDRRGRSESGDAELTNENLHTVVLALTRALAREVNPLMKRRYPTPGVYTRLREDADALFYMVNWVLNAGLFGPEEEVEEGATEATAGG